MMIHIRNLGLMLVTSAVIYIVLLSLSSYHEIIMKCGLITLTIYLTDIFIKFIWNSFHGPTLTNLSDRAVLITGCDTGFGNVLARQLDKKGVTVFAGCLFSDTEGAQKLKKDSSKNLHILQLNVTKEEEVHAAVKSVEKILNGKPLLSIVNNAGVLTLAEIEYLSTQEQKKVLEVNTFGISNVTQAFLPLLRKSKGRVVIVASIASYVAIPFLGAYNMSKFAAFAYAETLRREIMRWSVSVHTIEPWIYGTDMANIEPNLMKLRKEFSQAPEDTQKKYGGENYITLFKEIYGVGLVTSQSRSKLHEVTDCLEDAAIGKFPKLRYTPGLKGKFLTWIATHVPLEGIDLVCHLLLQFFFGRAQQGNTSKKSAKIF